MLVREANRSDAAAIASVHVDSWRSTYAGIMPATFLANLSHEDRRQMWHSAIGDTTNLRFVWVAEDPAGEVVGFAAAGPQRSDEYPYESELYAIYLLQNYQGRGIGRDLLTAIAQQILKAGMNSMMVWVLTENPARGFYEAMGGSQEYETEITIGGAVLKAVSFGWQDLDLLAARKE